MIATLDDALVDAARQGDSVALTSVYRALAPSVHGYLRTRGVEDPEAVTSDVFLAVLPKLRTVTGGAAGLRTFVFSVAHARMVDERRARARRPAAVEYLPDVDSREVASAETEALVGLGTDRVRAVLSSLPDDQREVIMLRVVADLSLDQVAEVMGRSTGAIKQLQRRGLITLRATLAGSPVRQPTASGVT